MKITFITAGGTIDKDYASSAGTYNFEIAEPAVARILQNINPNFEYEIIPVLKKDSLDMDDDDRQLLFDACSKTDNDKIIITHGTDTMVKTAEKLSTVNNKSIVLFGSSKPERFNNSDASFNLGAAVGVINCLKEGVYISMNGRVYEWHECQKELKTGQFIKK